MIERGIGELVLYLEVLQLMSARERERKHDHEDEEEEKSDGKLFYSVLLFYSE